MRLKHYLAISAAVLTLGLGGRALAQNHSEPEAVYARECRFDNKELIVSMIDLEGELQFSILRGPKKLNFFDIQTGEPIHITSYENTAQYFGLPLIGQVRANSATVLPDLNSDGETDLSVILVYRTPQQIFAKADTLFGTTIFKAESEEGSGQEPKIIETKRQFFMLEEIARRKAEQERVIDIRARQKALKWSNLTWEVFNGDIIDKETKKGIVTGFNVIGPLGGNRGYHCASTDTCDIWYWPEGYGKGFYAVAGINEKTGKDILEGPYTLENPLHR